MKVRIGFTCGTFDILHPGHVQMLREAKEQCDYLICGLQVDPSVDRPEKSKPIQTLVERYVQLSGIKYVDEVVPYQTEEDLKDILLCFRIDVRILGDEYIYKPFTGEDICKELGIEIFFNSRNHEQSSTNMRERMIQNANRVLREKE